MTQGALEAPVALLIFNRPETTAKVFAAVRAARPTRLLVVADGPRMDAPGEAELCRRARQATENVDWPCEVERLYAPVNRGCRANVAAGLDWVFTRCESAIILEDDCLPAPQFFPFCQELLRRYEHDPRVMHIGGACLDSAASPESYRFSRYAHVWGWASWSRAWKAYDVDMAGWGGRFDSGLANAIKDPAARRYWRPILDKTRAGLINTWDYQWNWAIWRAGGLCVVPSVNLVSNIGFGGGGTHLAGVSPWAEMPVGELEFPLRHPQGMAWDDARDADIQRRAYGLVPSLPARAFAKLGRLTAGRPRGGR